MNKLGEKMWHTRHRDFEPFDKITMEIVPRWKESELSGDEWRQHIEVQFWFKGHVINSYGAGDMRSAAAMLGGKLLENASPIADLILKLEDDLCDQPGCTEPPTHRYILKELFSGSGEKLDPSECGSRPSYRKFCEMHGSRGDCGREDSDDNYTKEAI